MDIALKESEAGEMFGYSDGKGARAWIDNQYDMYRKGIISQTSGKIERYSRRDLCRRMAALLDDIIKK